MEIFRIHTRISIIEFVRDLISASAATGRIKASSTNSRVGLSEFVWVNVENHYKIFQSFSMKFDMAALNKDSVLKLEILFVEQA